MEVEILNLDKNLYTKDITSFEVGLYKSFDTPLLLLLFSQISTFKGTNLYTKYSILHRLALKASTFWALEEGGY